MLKIQLDHKALLAVLEAGGEEMEIEIRRGVLESACKKAVKAIVGKDVQADIKKIITDELGYVDFRQNLHLSPKMTKAIQETAEAPIRDAVAEAVQPKKILAQAKKDVADVAAALELAVNLMIAERLNARIAAYIETQVKERLALLMAGKQKEGA